MTNGTDYRAILASETPLIDVRAPVEFSQSAMPAARPLPEDCLMTTGATGATALVWLFFCSDMGFPVSTDSGAGFGSATGAGEDCSGLSPFCGGVAVPSDDTVMVWLAEASFASGGVSSGFIAYSVSRCRVCMSSRATSRIFSAPAARNAAAMRS